MVLPSMTEPALDSTPPATNRASTRVVLPPPDGPTRTTLRTSPGLFALGAAPVPSEEFALSAMTFLQFSRGARRRSARWVVPAYGGALTCSRGVSQLTDAR